jgi:hypothetical protein
VKRARFAAAAVAVVLLLSAGVAAAEGAGTVYGRDNWPAELAKRSLTLPMTMIDVKVPVVVNLSKGSELEPWFLAPSAAIGLTDDLTLRGYTPEPGSGLCLAGSAHGCNKVWNDVGAELLYGLSRSQAQQFVLRGGVETYRLSDPMLLALKLGSTYKVTIGNMALVLGGDLRIGLTERDTGNIKETLTFYAEPQIQLTETLAVFGEIEAEVELQPDENPVTHTTPSIGDTLRIPFAVGAEWELMRRLNLGGKVRFANLFGRGGGADARMLVLFAEIWF